MRKYSLYLFCFIVIILLTACSYRDKAVSDINENTICPFATITAAPELSKPPFSIDHISNCTLPGKAVPVAADRESNSKSTEHSSDKTWKNNENSKYTIVIDAGHQKHHNSEQEPIGPGAKTTKDKVASGTQGRYTKVPEYQVNLDVSLKLKDILLNQGYQVIMIRETNKVDISNKERADIANKNKADVFVRIHCNGSVNTSVNGILTLCPTKKSPYCKKIYKKSRALSDDILDSLCEITGAKNKGVTETDTMSGINWSKVPVTIVEMGYMTNKKEDYLLSDDTYQDLLAQGIAEGILKYLN